MKNIIKNFKQFIKFFVVLFACREFAFLYCVIGTLGQVTHTYYLTNAISSLDGTFKVIQAVLISVFISSSLLYFVVVSDNSETKESKRIHLAINIFAFIEIVINFYYYCRHLILDTDDIKVFDFIFAILVSCLIPITIKLYASAIKAKEWLTEFENDSEYNKETVVVEQGLSKDDVETLVINLLESKNNTENSNQLDSILINQLLSENKELYNKLESINTHETNVDVESITENIKNTILENELKPIISKIEKTFIEEIKNNNQSVNEEEIKNILEEKINLEVKDILEKIDSNISNNMTSKLKLFTTQFENKCQVIIKKHLEELK